MSSLKMTREETVKEIEKISAFIAEQFSDSEKAVIATSGGLDSDVVIRLAANAIGAERMKLFTVIQRDMDIKHLSNARNLAAEFERPLIEIDLKDLPYSFMRSMKTADPAENFRPEGLLDPSRAKCSARTIVLSSYQDRGYIVIGTSNRTEFETGFFLPFGDGLGHLKPIIHLYKTQVRQIAEFMGTKEDVLKQPPSAGFWEGQEDIEDLSYWLFNEAPIGHEIEFDEDAEAEVEKIKDRLSIEKVDLGLWCISLGLDNKTIAKESGLPDSIVLRLLNLTDAAHRLKQRPLGVRLNNYS